MERSRTTELFKYLGRKDEIAAVIYTAKHFLSACEHREFSKWRSLIDTILQHRRNKLKFDENSSKSFGIAIFI